MSVKVMSAVWDSRLNSTEKFVLLAYADHADHDGRNIFPAYATIARKTSVSRRQVMRVAAALEARQILRRQGTTDFGTVVWRIDLEMLAAYRPRTGEDSPDPEDAEQPDGADLPAEVGGDTMTPPSDMVSPPNGGGVTPCHPPSDMVSPGGCHGVTGGVSPVSPESSFNRPLNVLKPSVGGDTKKAAADLDVIISGSNYSPNRVWEAIKQQIGYEMPKAAFEKYVLPANVQQWDESCNVLYIQAQGEYGRDWLQSRLVSTVRRLATGVLAREVDVQFVAG